MKSRKWTGLLLVTSMLANCADPTHPVLYPFPKQRYGITLTIDGAPAPIDSVTAYVIYEIANSDECQWQDPLSGLHVTDDYSAPLTFHPISNNAYKGTIYLDLPVEANYYSHGMCYWKLESVQVAFESKGIKFGNALFLADVLAQETKTFYPQKASYPGNDVADFNPGRPMSEEVAAHRESYFAMTLSAKEVSHD